MQTANELNIQKYVDIFYKYKWHGLIPAVLVMTVLGFASTFMPRVYESRCIVEVDRGTIENPLKTRRERPSELRHHLAMFSENALRWEILSRVIDEVGAEQLLENSDVYGIGKLMKKLGPAKRSGDVSGKSYAQKESLAKLLRDKIKLRPKNSRFLVLSYRGLRPNVNAKILNILVSTLIEEKTRTELDLAGRNYAFIKQELESYREKLEAAEDRLRVFKERHISDLPGNINLNLTQLASDKSKLLACELEIEELSTRLRYIEKELEQQNELIISEVRREANPMAVVLNERIVDMEIELTRLRTNYTEIHPKVVELRGQLQGLKSQRDDLEESTVDSETSMLNPVYQQLAQNKQKTLMTINGLRNRAGNLKTRIEENEEKIQSVPTQEQQLLTLTRNYEVTANIHNMLLQKVEEVRLQEKLALEERDMESFKVLEYARATLMPVAPKKLYVLLVILMAGAGMGFGIMLLLDFCDDSLNSVEEAKSFIGKPLLGTIPTLRESNGDVFSFIRRDASQPESEEAEKH